MHARSPPLNPTDLTFVPQPEFVVEDIDDLHPQVKLRSDFNVSANEVDEPPSARISYAGNQLWKTIIDTEEKIDVLLKLREEKGKKL